MNQVVDADGNLTSETIQGSDILRYVKQAVTGQTVFSWTWWRKRCVRHLVHIRRVIEGRAHCSHP